MCRRYPSILNRRDRSCSHAVNLECKDLGRAPSNANWGGPSVPAGYETSNRFARGVVESRTVGGMPFPVKGRAEG